MATDYSQIDGEVYLAGLASSHHVSRSQDEAVAPRVRGPTSGDKYRPSHPGTQSRRVHISEFAKWLPTLTLFG